MRRCQSGRNPPSFRHVTTYNECGELRYHQEVLDYIQLRPSDAALPERQEPSIIDVCHDV